MPKANNSARTESGLKYWRPIAASTAVIALFFIWGGIAKAPVSDNLSIGGHIFEYETADTPAQQAKGLAVRASLAADHAMLFRFPAAGTQCFWMKDMRFNLDIIWLSAQKKVVHIEPNLSPNSYPHSYCADDTQFVVEVNGGVSQQLGLQTGDTISF
jgi:uncharacterized membrane protein (UPF0127 family)